jgi:hypothetical protein
MMVAPTPTTDNNVHTHRLSTQCHLTCRMMSSSAGIRVFTYLFLRSSNYYNEHIYVAESLPKATLADESMSGKASDFLPPLSNHETQQYNFEVN